MECVKCINNLECYSKCHFKLEKQFTAIIRPQNWRIVDGVLGTEKFGLKPSRIFQSLNLKVQGF